MYVCIGVYVCHVYMYTLVCMVHTVWYMEVL